jgi:ornithine cyclodeaminase/alanine dehydrogenase-like protein (mu-crystallin family)
MTFLVISGEEVAEHLSWDACIPLMREAMSALSRGETKQLLRSIVDLDGGGMFGIMPGAMGQGPDKSGPFGAKLLSVFPAAAGVPSHRGMLVLFDSTTGAPACLIEAGELTAIRGSPSSAPGSRHGVTSKRSPTSASSLKSLSGGALPKKLLLYQ